PAGLASLRLARAARALRDGLARPCPACKVMPLSVTVAPAVLPDALLRSTMEGVRRFATGAGVISPAVAALVKEALLSRRRRSRGRRAVATGDVKSTGGSLDPTPKELSDSLPARRLLAT